MSAADLSSQRSKTKGNEYTLIKELKRKEIKLINNSLTLIVLKIIFRVKNSATETKSQTLGTPKIIIIHQKLQLY